MSTVPFNSIPSGLVAPIMTFEVNSGGAVETETRIVLVGNATGDGTIPANTPIYAASQEAVDVLCGARSMLRDMYRVARAGAPAERIDIVAVPAAGVAATWTVTLTTPPAAGGYGVLSIAGREVALTIPAGSTEDDAAADLAAAINGWYDEITRATLPVTAAAVDEVVTLTAVHAGAVAGDIDVWVDTGRADNTYVGIATVAAGTAGSGVPDTSAAIAAIGDDEATTVISPFGDAANLTRYRAMMGDAAGRWSWMRQVYGHVWTVVTDSVADLVTAGEAMTDDRHVTVLGRIEASGDSAPAWVWVAAYAAVQSVWLHDGVSGNVSRNMSGLRLPFVAPPRSRSKWPGYENRNALLKSRLSTWRIEGGAVVVDKAVTTSKLNALGQIDRTFRDVQALYQTMAALKYFRGRAAIEHGSKALASTNPGGNPAISTPTDILATFVHAYTDLVRRGVLEDVDGFVARAKAVRNDGSETRVDILAPLDRVNPLDVLAANAVLYAQF